MHMYVICVHTHRQTPQDQSERLWWRKRWMHSGSLRARERTASGPRGSRDCAIRRTLCADPVLTCSHVSTAGKIGREGHTQRDREGDR